MIVVILKIQKTWQNMAKHGKIWQNRAINTNHVKFNLHMLPNPFDIIVNGALR